MNQALKEDITEDMVRKAVKSSLMEDFRIDNEQDISVNVRCLPENWKYIQAEVDLNTSANLSRIPSYVQDVRLGSDCMIFQ
jgi:hypothetical protein